MSESQEPKIRIAPLSDFRPQGVNANKHTERGLRMLDDAMSEDGYVAPMTATADNEVIDGSARLERAFDKFDGSAIILEHDGTRPIITVRTDIANAQTKEAKRIALRANRIAEADLEWDCSVLAGLKEDGVTESLFTEKEWNLLVPEEAGSADAEIDVNRADELQVKWQVVPGEVIRVGRHSLYCGDSSNLESYSMLGEKFDLTLTDPPYNVGVDYGEGKAADEKSDFSEWLLPIFDLCMARSRVVIWTPGTVNTVAWIVARPPRWICAWHKANQCSRSPLGYGAWEPILFYAAGPIGEYAHLGQDAWSIPIAQQEDAEGHPCPKLLKLWQLLIAKDVKTILEPFAGSGTTMLAAQNVGASCFAIEREPKFCSLILERMSLAFPGIQIVRAKECAIAS